MRSAAKNRPTAIAALLPPVLAPITLDDQDVELISQVGAASVKYKFKLKDIVSAGKLEL